MGHIEIGLEDGSTKRINVTRAHLEEDAGKSVHEGFGSSSGIDLNRAGTPLIEIVSEPELRSAKEAAAYFRKMHSIVTYLGICDGDLSQGSMRCDCNVSLRPKGQEEFGTRAEIKNVNSFRNVERAIDAEIERQMDILEDGGTIVQETRLYDADKNETRSMRSKEEENDYRYFPCQTYCRFLSMKTTLKRFVKHCLSYLTLNVNGIFQNKAYLLSMQVYFLPTVA